VGSRRGSRSRVTGRRLLVWAAKAAGAVVVVAVIVIWNPFQKSTTPSSAANVRPYASGLASPTDIASTPAEPRRLYVVEQGGRIRYLVGNRIAGTFLDIRSRVSSGGERGLLSVAFSPRYARDHRFYVNYTDRNGDTRVVEFRSRNGKAVLSTARQLLFVKQPFPNHNGGQLQFAPDGLLWVGMGDGGSAGDPGNRAQTLSIHLGKLMRIDPFKRGARWQTIAYGLRNPWRFSFDRATGDLYIGDVGQNAFEEIDFRPRSLIGSLANYGWRVYEGRSRYTGGTPNARGQLVFPVAVYPHDDGCSVTGGYVYRGRAMPSSVGRYYYGDWCSGTIWSLRIENGAAVDVRKEPARIGQLTSFGEDAAGELYAVSGGSGRVYRVVP
jgi:glucose/arabinose dehydrogenase